MVWRAVNIVNSDLAHFYYDLMDLICRRCGFSDIFYICPDVYFCSFYFCIAYHFQYGIRQLRRRQCRYLLKCCAFASTFAFSIQMTTLIHLVGVFRSDGPQTVHFVSYFLVIIVCDLYWAYSFGVYRDELTLLYKNVLNILSETIPLH